MDLDDDELRATRIMNGADKPVVEDIWIIEKWIESCEEFERTHNLERIAFGTEGQRRTVAMKNIIKAYKENDKENNELRSLYRRTAIKLQEKGKEELAEYFLAQINEVPTFVVEDTDYYHEYYKIIERIQDRISKLNNEYEKILSKYGNIRTDVLIDVTNEKDAEKLNDITDKIIFLKEMMGGILI